MNDPSRPLTNRLRAHLPRAAALAVTAPNRSTAAGKDRIEQILNGLTIEQLRDLTITLALFTDTAALIGQSLSDPLEPVELAIRATANRFGVTPDEMQSDDRRRELAEARQVAAYIAHRLFGISSPDVGKMLHRDHSTVLYSCTRVGETPRLRRVALDIAQRVGWHRPGDDPTVTEVAS